MKAYVDKDLCIGCSLCADLCPKVFKMVDDKAVSNGEDIPKELTESAKDAALQCPVEAIKIE